MSSDMSSSLGMQFTAWTFPLFPPSLGVSLSLLLLKASGWFCRRKDILSLCLEPVVTHLLCTPCPQPYRRSVPCTLEAVPLSCELLYHWLVQWVACWSPAERCLLLPEWTPTSWQLYWWSGRDGTCHTRGYSAPLCSVCCVSRYTKTMDAGHSFTSVLPCSRNVPWQDHSNAGLHCFCVP